ncbi:hypothetical protein ASA1KI_27400 [Opitutales bacterium ASA1]|uniref:hypothetical protein n=1 Tax=Congregicoccus parvus TaxID=3081749 RepID=UPI002B2B1A56|nr:hypothetical protein ASA1KI_27400 [Opitutales bacterium ASA1]
MTKNLTEPEQGWRETTRLAREDRPPEVDESALLRAVRSALEQERRVGWFDELGRLFGRDVVVWSCLTGTSASVVFVWILATRVRTDLAWAQFAGLLPGGGS